MLLIGLGCLAIPQASAQDNSNESADNSWKSPDEDIMKILHAPQLRELPFLLLERI